MISPVHFRAIVFSRDPVRPATVSCGAALLLSSRCDGADRSADPRRRGRGAVGRRRGGTTCAAQRSLPGRRDYRASRGDVAEWRDSRSPNGRSRIPWRGGQLRAPALPAARDWAGRLLLVPGVHASGIDEPRLVGFARDLAVDRTSGRHRGALRPHALPVTAAHHRHDRGRRALADPRSPACTADGRIGMMGISFAGGLSIVAAGRPACAIAWRSCSRSAVTATCRARCTISAPASQPDGKHRPPHDYGVAIILLGVADQVVPAEQAPAAAQAILSFLEASRLDMVDKAAGRDASSRARGRWPTALPEPSRTLMAYVNNRDVAHLGPDPAAAPGRARRRPGAVARSHAPPPSAPSTCCTASTTTSSRRSSRRCSRGRCASAASTVHFLATPLITHAEVDRAARCRRPGRWCGSGVRCSTSKASGAGFGPRPGFRVAARRCPGTRRSTGRRRLSGDGRRSSSASPPPPADSSRKSPGRSRSSVIGPIATRRSRTTG